MQTKEYLLNYTTKINDAFKNLDSDVLEQVVSNITRVGSNGGTVFVCGNGGSAAISEHFTVDHSKSTFHNTGKKFKFISLTSNISMITALANDQGYENVFSEQLNLLGRKGDMLITISASGNSPNVVNAIDMAKSLGMETISLTGFKGGQAHENADLGVHVDLDGYGLSEDSHSILMHVFLHIISISNRVDNNTLRL